MEPFNSVAHLLRFIETTYSKNDLLAEQGSSGEWRKFSSEEIFNLVKYCTLGLHQLGIKKGDMVGILANPSSRWTVADLAIMMLGAVSVPLFSNISEENFGFEIEQTKLKHIFVAGEEQWKMIGRFKEQISSAIALYDEIDINREVSFTDLCREGKKLDAKEPALYESLRDRVGSDDLASIVYTSGTTGLPKGVMLSQKNMIGVSHQNPFGWNESDLYLSILPLAHIFARSLNFILLSKGASIYYLREIKTFGDESKKIHPSILVVVPRLLEKTYSSIVSKVKQAPLLKRAIGLFALSVAKMKPHSKIKKFLYPFFDSLVYSTIRKGLGGNVRHIISGGAALNPFICNFFLGIGLPVYEGWGLTEACPLTINLPGDVAIGTVGALLEDIEIKVNGKGELLVKGPVVMQGYYKNKEATNEVFTHDGWLRTGDKGSRDQEGKITILARVKEMYRTSTGKWIAPVPIEQELCKASYIDMAMVVGEGQKYASCLLFPDFEELHLLKRQNGLEKLSDREFLESDYMKKKMSLFLEQLNSHLNHWEKVQTYQFVESVPSIGSGELTPTLKLRREIICKKYAPIIQKLYRDEAA